MASAMSVSMTLMQVASGISGSAATIAFATWHRGFGSAINRLRSAVFGASLVLFLFLRFGAWDADLSVYEIVIRFWCLQKGPADINAADQSTSRLLCQDIVHTCVCLTALGALERVGHTTFGGAKNVFRRASLLSSAKPSSSLSFSLSTSRPYAPNTLLPASPPPSPLFPALALASVKTKKYSRAGVDGRVQLRPTMYLAFYPSDASSVHGRRNEI